MAVLVATAVPADGEADTRPPCVLRFSRLLPALSCSTGSPTAPVRDGAAGHCALGLGSPGPL